ncbi:MULTISPECIES: RraA family protein [Ramlibacter]|uniref:Putative 4-hydroxy-4-methyl-2-oxoglutarate aldolase n=1 Tax=Ramlibacter pinisoli TaxID=2682844 RepID=A0A6N8IRE5_9BURK|nr:MULTISPECIES: RraA family protein [Ramlibacter]MBA2964523.1 RraA family protein [Ramlibacter sp. CGMCC 1.13660]MVQ29489.1 RraA family protein [Ramlibacter pinisoli]
MVGLQILKRRREVPAQLVKAFKGLPVANVSDCMTRMTAGGARLRPMHRSGYLAGPALTVKTRPGDNLMIHKALTMARPGDVIVVDAGGDLTNSLFGEIMVATAVKIGVAGVVLNGAVRDAQEIGQGEFPLYAAGVTHRGPYKDGPGEINVPISIDGMVIHPGDLILGDADGLLCVPFDDAEEILAATHRKMDAEKKTLADIAAGRLDTSWIDATLQRIGCNTEPK